MKKKLGFSLVAVFLLFIIVTIADYFLAAKPTKVAYYDLKPVLLKENLTKEDYELIFQQTGLGKSAVLDIKEQAEDFVFEIEKFQKQKLSPLHYRQDFLFFPTTTAEQLEEENGVDRRLEIPPLRDGDILITKSTKTLLYRHGHGALVLDAEKGLTIEALMIGSPSEILKVDLWRYYPTLMVLRAKNVNLENIQKTVDYAKEELYHVPYRLTTGLIKKDKSDFETVDGTHCAHLVWQAFKQAGVDIDADGGWLVTPHDIAESHELEIVFSFGFGERAIW